MDKKKTTKSNKRGSVPETLDEGEVGGGNVVPRTGGAETQVDAGVGVGHRVDDQLLQEGAVLFALQRGRLQN